MPLVAPVALSAASVVLASFRMKELRALMSRLWGVGCGVGQREDGRGGYGWGCSKVW